MPLRNDARLLDWVRSGLWLSLPVAASTLAAWLAGVKLPALYLLLVAGALSLPWGLLAGFGVWLALSSAAAISSFDAFFWIYWGCSLAAILGAHLNGMLLFGVPPQPSPPEGRIHG